MEVEFELTEKELVLLAKEWNNKAIENHISL
jgi:hypothetical protein